jgi:hypothetical protein
MGDRVLSYLLVSQSNDRPFSQADVFLDHSLNPRLVDRVLLRDTVDGNRVNVSVAKVGLVEHVAIVEQTKEVTHSVSLLGGEKVVEGTRASGGVDPFKHSASRSVAVVVNASGPAGVDLNTIETVVGDGGEERPHGILGVQKSRAGVVTNAVSNAICPPGAQGITVVQTSDSRRNDTVGSELGSLVNTDGLEPSLVEADLLVNISVGGVVLLLMSKGVGDVTELVEVAFGGPPEQKFIHGIASRGPVVGSGGSGPQVGTSADGLLELKSGISGRVILDSGTASAPSIVGAIRGVLNVTVTIVTNFDEVGTTSGHNGVDAISPGGNVGQILCANTEVDARRRVDFGLKEHVINLGIEVDTTVSGVQTTGDPGNPCVLQVAGSSTPGSVKPNEEGHLLTAIEVVNDTSNTFSGEASGGSKRGNLFGRGGVADSRGVVPQTAGADTCAGLETRCGEIANVGERDELLNASVTASPNGGSAVVGARVDIVLHHANTILKLVSIKLVPLISGQGTLEAEGTIVIADFRGNDNTAEVSSGSTVKSGKGNTS